MDIVIVGSGIAGLGTAMAFTDAGKKVMVLEKKMTGEASQAAAGILDPFLERGPRHPLLPLAISALRKFPQLIQKIRKVTGGDAGYRCAGLMYVAFTPAEEKILRAKYRWQKKTGVALRWLKRHEVVKREPGVCGSVRCGIYYPGIGRVIAPDFLRSIRTYLIKKGCLFRTVSRDPRPVTDQKGVKRFMFGAGGNTYLAADMVFTRGAWEKYSPKKNVRPWFRPVRGQALIVRMPRCKLMTTVHSVRSAYVVPWQKSVYLLGSTVEFSGFRPHTTRAGLCRIRDGAQRLVPAFRSARMIRKWAGLRPISRDRLPVIGRTGAGGAYLLNGLYRSGILLGCELGRLLSHGIMRRKMPKIIEPYSPGRIKI